MAARPAPPERTAWLGRWQYAHRGLHGPGIPENSFAAFAGAIGRGLGIECDVQRSADVQPMVFHDWDLGRLTTEDGPVMDRSAHMLGAVTLRENGERIPDLATCLAEIAGRVPVLIEIKSKRELPVAAFCRSIAMDLQAYVGDHAVMSFDPRVGHWFARHSPQTVRGLVVTEEGSNGFAGKVKRHLALRAAKPDFLAYDIRDLPSPFAAACRRRGMPVLTWTVRSPELAARAALHADAPIAEGEGLT